MLNIKRLNELAEQVDCMIEAGSAAPEPNKRINSAILHEFILMLKEMITTQAGYIAGQDMRLKQFKNAEELAYTNQKLKAILRIYGIDPEIELKHYKTSAQANGAFN